MDKVWANAMEANKKHDAGRDRHVAEKHGDISSYGSCTKCHGEENKNVEGKKKEMAKKMKQL